MNITCECGHTDNIEVKDKKGFLCEVCGTYFDVCNNGSMVKYPVNDVRVSPENVIDGCFGEPGLIANKTE